jgi:hypothetical protein
MHNPIRLSDLDMTRARRKLKRKVAAAIITAMAETDADYEWIATRLEQKPAEIERWIVGLITGETKCMDEASDLMLAMALEFNFSLQRYNEPLRPGQSEQNQEVSQAAA